MARAREATQADPSPQKTEEQGRRATEESAQPLQVRDYLDASRGGGASPALDPRVLIRRALAEQRRPKKPGEAELDVDGVEMDTDWDEPATEWMQEKRAAVKRVMASLVNEPDNLPEIGRRVDRVVRQVGTADIYFDDGSWVSANVDDPQPDTSDEAAVIEKVYGKPSGACPCGYKASALPPLVAALREDELLGVVDARTRGATDPSLWRLRLEPPFDLHVVRGAKVPPGSFKIRSASVEDRRRLWVLLREHVKPRPLARVR